MSGHDGQRDDYLWDRSGPVDPEIARLEHLLRGHAQQAPRRAARSVPATHARRPRRWRVSAPSSRTRCSSRRCS